MELELWVHDAISGDERKQVFPLEIGASWSTNIPGTGECTWAFLVGDDEAPLDGDRIATLFQPNARLISLRWGTAVLGSWKIEDWDFSGDTNIVTVTGVELRNETKWRMTYGLSGYGPIGTLEVENRSYVGAVRAILARFMQWSPEWFYPIDLPADEAGGFSQVWEFWKKLTIEDLLVQIESEGIEIYLRPYLTVGRQLRYQPIVQTRITIGSSSFHLQAEDSPLSGIHYRVNGAEQITGGQGLGEGSGQDQDVKFAGAGPYPIPIRDAKMQFPDMTDDRLQSATNAWYAQAKEPTVQWTVDTFTMSDEHPPTQAVPGAGWKLQSKGHPVYPDGVHGLRVIAASGTFGKQIKTEVQGGA